jgi:peptide/nickel transport system ATP-binding protein
LQRAMIAMALLNDPDLIVFDEPTTALDVTTQLEVLSVIRQVVAEQGCAAIYVSHDLAVVSQICDDIIVLRHGKVIEANSTRDIIDRPQETYTRSLVAHRKVGEFLTDTGQDDAVPLISAEALTLGYGKMPIVRDAAVTLNENEVLAIVGESGSGKTTVARAFAGLLEPWSGKIRLKGEELAGNVDNRSQAHRQRIQFIHQLPDVALNPRQTIRTALARPLQVFKGLTGAALDGRLNALMDEVELPRALLDRYPGALSGGQKQRVCIARCLAAEPDLLICDEVTAALDPLVEDSILALLWRLKEEHRMAIVFITHNLGVTRRFAHSLIIMEHGEIVEQGPTAQVFANPQQAYTLRLLASEPSTEAGWIDAREREAATRLAQDMVPQQV